MAEVSLKLIPGVNVEKTSALNESGISSCNYIRFKDRLPQKLGGWEKYYPLTLPGVPRELHAWKDLNNNTHLAAATTTQLDVITDGMLQDITPQTKTTNFAPNFDTVISSTTVIVDDSNIANVTVYDSIFFNTPVSVGGLVLAGTYPIAVIAGTTTYNIIASSSAASTITNGGSVPSFTTSSGSNVITVNFTAHGLVVGNFFTFPITTSVGGTTVFGTYKVIAVSTLNSFTIATSSSATSSTTVQMNGGNAQLVYYINLGPAAAGVGYGIGAYGAGGYGSGVTPTSQTGTPITATDWTLDNWGEILLACPADGGVYQWQPSSGFTNAGLVATAPIFNSGIFVAMPEQILVCYGSTAAAPGSTGNSSSPEQQGPLIVRWSDSLDFTNFTVSSLTQAGSFHIPKGSMIVGGLQGPQQALIWTDLSIWAMSYMGPPFVFGFNELSSGCGLIGPHGAVVMRGSVYWLSSSNFFRLSGQGVENIPCSVWDVIFQDMDTDNQSKCRLAANSAFDELWAFFPSASGGTGEVDKYVKLNIEEGTWDYGTIGRSAWIDQSVLGQPIGASPQGIIYQHESGMDADGQAMTPYFVTGWFVIAEGQNMAFMDWMFPDMKWGTFNGSQNASIQMTIETTAYPNQTPDTFGPFTMSAAKEYINLRLRGRMIRLTISSSDLGSFWRLGVPRYRAAISGRR